MPVVLSRADETQREAITRRQAGRQADRQAGSVTCTDLPPSLSSSHSIPHAFPFPPEYFLPHSCMHTFFAKSPAKVMILAYNTLEFMQVSFVCGWFRFSDSFFISRVLSREETRGGITGRVMHLLSSSPPSSHEAEQRRKGRKKERRKERKKKEVTNRYCVKTFGAHDLEYIAMTEWLCRKLLWFSCVFTRL